MKTVIFVSRDPELVADAKDVCQARDLELWVEPEWEQALSKSVRAELLVVDLLATLTIPHRISGYVRFAEAKMASAAASTPLVLIGVPEGYRLDGMAGWLGFLQAFVERPVDEDRLHYLLDFV